MQVLLVVLLVSIRGLGGIRVVRIQAEGMREHDHTGEGLRTSSVKAEGVQELALAAAGLINASTAALGGYARSGAQTALVTRFREMLHTTTSTYRESVAALGALTGFISMLVILSLWHHGALNGATTSEWSVKANTPVFGEPVSAVQHNSKAASSRTAAPPGAMHASKEHAESQHLSSGGTAVSTSARVRLDLSPRTNIAVDQQAAEHAPNMAAPGSPTYRAKSPRDGEMPNRISTQQSVQTIGTSQTSTQSVQTIGGSRGKVSAFARGANGELRDALIGVHKKATRAASALAMTKEESDSFKSSWENQAKEQ